MELPFTHSELLDVFAPYNRAIRPVAALLWLEPGLLVGGFVLALHLAGSPGLQRRDGASRRDQGEEEFAAWLDRVGAEDRRIQLRPCTISRTENPDGGPHTIAETPCLR